MFSTKRLLYIETLFLGVFLVFSFYFIHHSISLQSKLDQKSLDYENLLSEKLEIEKSILQSIKSEHQNFSFQKGNANFDKNVAPSLSKDSIQRMILNNEMELIELSKKIDLLKSQLNQTKGNKKSESSRN